MDVFEAIMQMCENLKTIEVLKVINLIRNTIEEDENVGDSLRRNA